MATETKRFDFSTDNGNASAPKIQITSKKVVPTAFDDVMSAVDSLSSDPLVRPRVAETILTLDLPNELSFAAQLDWSFEERNIIQSLIGNSNSNRTMDTVREKPEAVIAGLSQRIGIAATSAFGTDIAFRNAGYALAPLKEIFFNGNSNRTFPWSWDLFPRNKTQADNIMNMSDRIYEQAHPVMQDVGVFQIPNEFEIEWINCFLPKISTCACILAEPDFAPTGAPRFHADGNPAFVRLKLSFTEITIQTRNSLEGLRSK